MPDAFRLMRAAAVVVLLNAPLAVAMGGARTLESTALRGCPVGPGRSAARHGQAGVDKNNIPHPSGRGAPSPTEGEFAGRIGLGGGRHLFLECAGRGRPVVVLEAGLRNRGDIWSVQADDGQRRTMVFPGVAAFTRVCAYDRPGTTVGVDQFSRSDPVRQPRTTKEAVADLHALLRAAKLPGPYVLVGHSTGGLIVRLYASTYPEEVAGMVLVDAIPETMQTSLTPANWAVYNEKVLLEPPAALAGYRDLETIDFVTSFEQMRRAAAARPLRDIPLVVLSHDRPSPLPGDLPADFKQAVERAWGAGQDRLAALLPDARRDAATNSGHYIQLEQPRLVIDAIRQVVEAVRRPDSWKRRP
jgi:pimeloyl-ACP methyl ester carboxylesterase